MSENATGTPASEGDPSAAGAAASGAPSEGSGGTENVADSFAAERERLEARARAEQGRADQNAAKVADLERRLAELESGAGAGQAEGEASPATDPAVEALRGQVASLEKMLRAQTLAPIVESLKGEFEHADPSLFKMERATRFETPESLRAAVEASHNERKAFGEAYSESQLAALRKQYADQYGLTLATPPAAGGGDTPAGDPTPEQLARMSIVELDELGEEVVNRVLRSA